MRTNRPSPNKVVAQCAMNNTLDTLVGTENERYLLFDDGTKRERTAFKHAQRSAEDIKDLLLEGYAMCQPMKWVYGEEYEYQGNPTTAYYTNLLSDNYRCLKSYFKTKEGFDGSNVIFIDVDHGCYDASAFFNRLGTKLPTVAVPSYSDDPEGERRFHLVYGFDKVLDKSEWLYQARAITTYIENHTGVEIDHSMLSPNQYMNGSNRKNISEEDVMVNDYVYSVGDFSMTNEEEEAFEKRKSSSASAEATRINENGQGLDSMDMFSDWLKGALKDNLADVALLDLARQHGWYPIKRKEGMRIGDIVVIEGDIDVRINPKYKWINGKCEMNTIDKGKRANTLYAVGCGYRFNMTKPTADSIFLNIVNYNHSCCDLTDEPVSRREMIRITNSIMNLSDENLRDRLTCKKRKDGKPYNRLASGYYIADDVTDKRKVRSKLESDNNRKYIELAIHNLELKHENVSIASVTKELKSMYEEGYVMGVGLRKRKCTISRNTVQRYFQEQGMDTKSLDLTGLEIGMSIRKIMKLKHCTQYKAYKYLKELSNLNESI